METSGMAAAIAPVDLESDEGIVDAVRRFRKCKAAHSIDLKQKRVERGRLAAESEAERKIKRCSLCRKAQAEVRWLWGDTEFGHPLICDECATKAIKARKPPKAAKPKKAKAKGLRQMLKMRMIGVNDYSVLEDGQPIGRIRYASERTPGKWLALEPDGRHPAVR